MNFKGPYLFAMRERAPKMFVELCRSGLFDQYLQEKSIEAHALLEQLLAREPKGIDGLPKDPQALRLAEEIVLGQMLDFPASEKAGTTEQTDGSAAPPAAVASAHLRVVKT
jgi:hypothetical protein